jgi:hypothetical protein
MLQLGSLPDVDQEILVDLTPVDYVSQAIVHLSMDRESTGKIFHIVNPRPMPLRELLDWMREFGYPIEQISLSKFRSAMKRYAERAQPGVLTTLIKDASKRAAQAAPPSAKQRAARREPTRIECENTLNSLRGSSIACPPVDDALLNTYFTYFIRNGFPDPSGSSSRAGRGSAHAS